MGLRQQLVKLAHLKPELRADILALVRKTVAKYVPPKPPTKAAIQKAIKLFRTEPYRSMKLKDYQHKEIPDALAGALYVLVQLDWDAKESAKMVSSKVADILEKKHL